MRNPAIILFLALSLFIGGVSRADHDDEKIIVAGTGDSQALLALLAHEFEADNPGHGVQVPESVGSKGGIKAVTSGNVALARTARPLKENEKEGLVEFLFAKSPIVFAVHPSVEGLENLSREQIMGVYSGKIANWSEVGGPDHKIYAVDRESGDSSRTVLEKFLPGFNAVESHAHIVYTTPETVDAIADHKFTIGFIPLSAALGKNLKILSIDGVSPEGKNIESGDYPFASPFFIVSKGEPGGVAGQFVKFLFSSKAKEAMRKAGVISMGKAH